MNRGDGSREPRAGLWGRLLGAGLVPRAAVTVLGVPLLAAAAVQGGLVFRALIGLLVLLGVREFLLLMSAKGYGPFKVIGTLAALACAWAVAHGPAAAVPVLTAALLAVMTVELMRRNMDRSLNHVAVTLFGALYVGWLGGFLVLLRETTAREGVDGFSGLRAIALLAALTWACDTLAFLVGVAVGRRPLLPRVSPRKSVEGAVGGVLGATAAGLVAAGTFAPFLSPLQGGLLGAVCGVTGQVGDLVESMLKRDAGVKDTADLLPGHGGILDRFDSLLFNAPVVYYALVLFGVANVAR
ncbi:MAG: phosphatidate cytidylyltransferase [Candidatus Latescibacteria bacterium]|nr:phosphatidate cytidylyltransferase [Candidatus Latescibacterota bacterium]